jgi:hypothetical protein
VIINEAIDENMLQIGGYVYFGAAKMDAALDNFVGKPSPSVQGKRSLTSLTDGFQDIPGDSRFAFVKAVGGANCRSEYS